MDIARQPLLVACLTLAAVAVAAIWCGSGGSAPSPVRPDALPGDWVSAFQLRCPGWSRWIALFCILFTGIYLGRFSNRFNLYAGRCYLPIPFFGMAACCFGAGGGSLLHFVVAAIAAIAVRNCCAAFPNGYGFNELFRASLCLGLLPLLSPATWPVWLLLPMAVFLFGRTLRETAVAVFGLGLPLFALCYLSWARGDGFAAPAATLFDRCAEGAGWPVFIRPETAVSCIPLLLAGGLLLLTAGAAAIHFQTFYNLPRKARLVLVFCVCCFVSGLSTLFFSAGPSQVAALCAVPAAVLLPVLFVRSQHLLASVIYVSLLVGSFISTLLQ